MIAPQDLAACKAAIQTGSLSFYAASRLLPAKVRDPALALYAFCRLADDAVDENSEKEHAVLTLRDRLDLIYAGRPINDPADRAFAAVIEDFNMPRALPEALLEGLAWDAVGRRCDTQSDLYAYSARVAAAVGAMMCVLMRVRSPDALARACDLGVAMQLTNIARDVGEDAAEGRIYLPLDWLAEIGLSPEAFLADPNPSPQLRGLIRRLLMDADRLYYRSEAGVPLLPFSARPGIYAARHIYAGIGSQVARANYDSLSQRAHTSKGQKLGWLTLAATRAALSAVIPKSPVRYGRPLPEVAFLVDAAARKPRDSSAWGEGRAGSLVAVFAELEARDREKRGLAQ